MAEMFLLVGLILIIYFLIRGGLKQNNSTAKNIQHYKTDKNSARRILKQLSDSLDMVDKTLNPETFFGRLHFSFDCILELMTYRPTIFKDATPEEEYTRLLDSLNERVDALIERTYNNEIIKASALKTEKARLNRLARYFDKMEIVFNNANNYWAGNSNFPHYEGSLYTEANINKLAELKRPYAK